MWVLSWPVTEGSDHCEDSRRLVLVDAHAATARAIGTGVNVADAGDADSFWTTTEVASVVSGTQYVVQRVQRRKLSGGALGHPFELPPDRALIKGLSPDLLLLFDNAAQRFESWQPSARRVLGTYGRVLAASKSVVAWVGLGCAYPCPVHLSPPTGGADRTVPVPRGAYAIQGSVSSDGKYVALTLGTGVAADGATNQDTGVLIEVATRKMRVIPQTAIPVSEESGFLSLTWASRSWLLVTTPGPKATRQVAAYNPATGAFVVPRLARHVAEAILIW
ncbi:MAG: hypothetical protein QOG49_1207 [Frankiaceae bacterium]|nr:hypothetical protein [Frankiaceae bacterium]